MIYREGAIPLIYELNKTNGGNMKKIYNSRVELLSDIEAGVDVSNTDVSKVTDMS